MSSQSWHEALAAHHIPEPLTSIQSNAFTRWGKNNRYYAKQVDDGYIFGDWTAGINASWFPYRPTPLTQREQTLRALQVRKAQQQAEKERAEQHNKVAEELQTQWDWLALSGESPYLARKQVEAFNIRFQDDTIIIPLRNVEGELRSWQSISPQGEKRFFKGGQKSGCFHTMGELKDGESFYVVEGYATGASVYMATCVPVVVAMDAGNMPIVCRTLQEVYPHSVITIAADNDEAGIAAAKKTGCHYVLPIIGSGTDFNDVHVQKGVEEVRRQLTVKELIPPTLPIPVETSPILPVNFSLTASGVYYQTNEDTPPRWICSPLRIIANTRDAAGHNWGVLLEWEDGDGRIHQWSMPMALLAGDAAEMREELLSRGLKIATNRQDREKLSGYIQSIYVSRFVTAASRIGWHNHGHFILPDRVIPTNDDIFLQVTQSLPTGFATAGTLEEWQRYVAMPCQGNSRLVCALSCAFAAPLLYALNLESGGFNLKGASSIGKSTALAVAGSVWGGGGINGFMRSWRATGNALEVTAEGHNDCLLCLDELGQVDGKEAGEIVYMLANGAGKSRSRAKGGLRKPHEWRSLFLSTGELSIADKIHESGKRIQAGMAIRLVDIPADAGKGYKLFDTLHDFPDGNALAQHLKDATRRYYGTPIRAYLESVVPTCTQLAESYQEFKRDVIAQHLPLHADSQVQRVLERFTLVAYAGELAIRLGVLPYTPGEAIEACGQCFNAWLLERGNTGSHEEETILRQVRAFIESNYSSRFATMGVDTEMSAEKIIPNQAGFKRKTADGRWEFFVFTEIFLNEICQGFDARIVCQILVKHGLLKRGNTQQFVKLQRLPIGSKKIYHLTADILTEAAE